MALIRFLAAARDGVVGVACIHPRMDRNGRAFLVPLPLVVCRVVDDIGLLETICGSSLDPVTSLVAYSRSSEFDWA